MRVNLLSDRSASESELEIIIQRADALRVERGVTVSLTLCHADMVAEHVDRDPQPDVIQLGLLSGPGLETTDKHSLVGLLRSQPPLGFIVNHEVWRNQELKRMLLSLTSKDVPTKGGTRLWHLTPD